MAPAHHTSRQGNGFKGPPLPHPAAFVADSMHHHALLHSPGWGCLPSTGLKVEHHSLLAAAGDAGEEEGEEEQDAQDDQYCSRAGQRKGSVCKLRL